MPLNKNNKLDSMLPQLNTFCWEIDIAKQAISFDETAIQVFGKNFKLSQSLNSFIQLLDKNSQASFEQVFSSPLLNDSIQIYINVKTELHEISIILNGSNNLKHNNSIQGIGFPLNQNVQYQQNSNLLESAILEKAPLMFSITDQEGNISYINSEFSKITGYSKEELKNENIRILKSGFHSNSFYKNLWETIKKGKTWEGKFLNQTKSGQKYWERAIISPYLDERSGFSGYIKASEDISQKENIKKQLQAERNLFLAGPVIVLKWDTAVNGRIEYASPNINDVLGYTPEEFIHDVNYIDIIHPADREQIVSETQKYIDLNETCSFKQAYRLKAKNGSYRHIIDHTSIEIDEKQEFVNFSGYLYDNTDFVEAQAELKKSQIKYKDVFNTAGVGIIYTNKEGIIVDTNRKFEELIFAKPRELVGKSAMELLNTKLTGKDTIELLPILFHILKGNKIEPKQIHVQDKYYEIQSDYNPHLQSNIGILRDITEQKIASEKVKESEKKYKYLINNMNDGLMITNANDRISFMNKASKKIFEEDLDTAKHKSISDFATSTSKDVIQQQLDLRRKGKTTTYFIEIITKNNIKKNLEITASPLFENEEYSGAYGIIRDISEQIQSEIELKSAYSQLKLINRKLQEHAQELEIAKEKAEESERLKTAFLANISHEIRTPMNGIVGFAQLSMNPGLPEEKRNNYLQIVTDSTLQLESVVMDIIDLSKIEGGEARFNKKETNIEELINEAFESYEKDAIEKNLEYSWKKLCILHPISTDKIRFRQVLKILLNNAIKFTSEGRITLTCDRSDNEIIIKVIDSGIGIDSEHFEMIFEPFRQVEMAMKRRFGGTGLGLAIAKKIADTLGGSITVESELGKGSTFTFTHPTF